MKYIYNHKTNEEYIKLQAEKSSDPNRQKIWISRYEKHCQKFMARFKMLDLVGKKNVITLGARMGGEVEAFKRLGHNAVGIDLVPHPDRGVIYGDFHEIPFKDATFDVVYSNALDHSNNVPQFISESKRVLESGGLLVLDVFFGLASKYEENEFESVADVKACVELSSLKFIKEQPIPKQGRLYPKGKEIQLIFMKV